MRKIITFIILFPLIYFNASAQTKGAYIQNAQFVKASEGLMLKQGYLVVPENRKTASKRTIKIPFVFVRKAEQSARKNIFLYSTGGPGYSSIGNWDSIGPSFGYLDYGGFIVFDQRGTKRCIPSLQCPEIDEAVRTSYLKDLNRDSLLGLTVRQCRTKFQKQGIDLSAYNTTESAEDINDLRLLLKIDSVHLVGASYSGGLMLTVARNHPEGVQTLILNSPLPVFTNYDEQALLNINEALDQVFDNCRADSAGSKLYLDIKSQFHNYFTTIAGKTFSFKYKPKEKKDSVTLHYTKSELMDVIVNKLNTNEVKEVPSVINDIIHGKHARYLQPLFEGYFDGDPDCAWGMRYSVFCSEQTNWASLKIEKEQARLLPWLAGYAYNNVDHNICTCWNVAKEPAVTKTPVYAAIPVLLSGGDIDPGCRPFYNQLIKRAMPNAQILTVHNAGHCPGFIQDHTDYIKMFLENPLKKLVSASKNVKID